MWVNRVLPAAAASSLNGIGTILRRHWMDITRENYPPIVQTTMIFFPGVIRFSGEGTLAISSSTPKLPYFT